MMKIRRVNVLLILLALVLLLCSCDEASKVLAKIPYTSENFSQEFMDSFDSEYRLYDSNLYYLSANPFEVRTSDYSGVFQYDVEALILSTIKDVPKEEFVAVTHFGEFILMPGGGRDITCHVYQSKDAPVIMKDYTISSVSIIGWKLPPYWYVGSGSSNFNKIMDQAPNYFETFLESRRTAIVAEYTSDGHPEFIESLKNGYSNSTADKAIYLTTNTIYRIDEGDPNHEVYYSLLFRFEETDNLVWCVPIVKNRSTEEWYYSFGYYEYVPYTQSGGREYLRYEKVKYHAPISEEAKTIIREAIKYELH